MISSDDTIAAVATPIGEGGLAVIRISGKRAVPITSVLFKGKDSSDVATYASHTLHYGRIEDPHGQLVDQVVLGVFHAPHSYTGENVMEISCHGSLAVTKKILDLLIQHGARHAEPGEFTKRAFLNGKIDLAQAEAVLDLIKAKSSRAAEIALQQLSGALSKKIKLLKDRLMHLYAHLEAYLDFPEDDLEVYTDNHFLVKLNEIRAEMTKLISGFKRGSLLREGLRVVIAGKPNVGKSSLFNALLERDRALVSPYPGTTRDHLEEFLEIQGVCIRLIDTAGLANSVQNPLDEIGMQRTRQAFENADLYLFMMDGSCSLEENDVNCFKQLRPGIPCLTLINKSDLPQKISLADVQRLCESSPTLSISSQSANGFNELENEMIKMVFGNKIEIEAEQISRLRHRNALEKSLEFISHAEEALKSRKSLEFVALEIKTALETLKELVGEVYSDDLLDVIFSEFCIGK